MSACSSVPSLHPLKLWSLRESRGGSLLGNLETTLVELRVLSRLREAFLFATGELLTNAVYDAPVDGAGRPRYLNWSRTRSVVLGPEAIVDVEFRVDERRLGISVVDRFGSLSPESVLRYLAKCLRRDEQQVDDKLGGAGMGLFYVLMSVSHLVFNIEPGRRTEAIAILELRPSYRDFAVRAKSFDIFTVGQTNG